MPSTSILWCEIKQTNDRSVKFSTSRQLEFDELNVEHPNRDRIKRNLANLIEHVQSTSFNEYKWDYLSIVFHEMGVYVIHGLLKIFKTMIGYWEGRGELVTFKPSSISALNSNLPIII